MVIKTKEEARAHFEAALPYIPTRYKEGVSKADWKTAAASDAAEANFANAMSKVIAEKRRQKAIQAVSNEYWQSQAINLGAAIIADRIRAALDKWLEKWGPIYDKVVAVVKALPPRTLDWKANINNRLIPVVEAWKKAAGKA